MLASLLALMLAAPALEPAQANDPLFTTIRRAGLEFRYIGTEISDEEAELMLGHFAQVRRWFGETFDITTATEITITVRLRQSLRRFFYTNGKDQVFIDFSDPGLFRPIQEDDERLYSIARPVFAQLWLSEKLTSMAGLDPRVVQSIDEFIKAYSTRGSRQSLGETVGQVWEHLDTFYGDGVSSFVLNSLEGEKIPAHLLGKRLREIAADATEDEESGSLFDTITPPTPIYAAEDFEPGDPLVPGTTLRLSRMALSNGVRLTDHVGEPLALASRVVDFDSIFMLLSKTYPDSAISARPPTINDVDLWQLYFEFRARVELAKDNLDYYLVLRELLSRFRDRWINIRSTHGAPHWMGVPGIDLELVGDKVFVSYISEDSAPSEAGVRRGMELVEIDGQPTRIRWQALKDYFLRNESCNSDKQAEARALNVLLTGAENTSAEVKLVSPGGDNAAELSASLPRGLPTGGPSSEFRLVEHEKRDDGISVIRIRSFAGDAGTQFSVALNEAMGQNAKGVVIDVRGNEGGDRIGVLAVLGRLLDDKVVVGEIRSRDPQQPDGFLNKTQIQVNPIPPVYPGPVAVLTDEWTSGPAELVAMGLLVANRGPVVGRTTAGSANHPIMPAQPWQTLSSTGITVSMAAHLVHNRDGSALQGSGVTPTIPCERTPQEIAQGIDAPLEAAVNALRK